MIGNYELTDSNRNNEIIRRVFDWKDRITFLFLYHSACNAAILQYSLNGKNVSYDHGHRIALCLSHLLFSKSKFFEKCNITCVRNTSTWKMSEITSSMMALTTSLKCVSDDRTQLPTEKNIFEFFWFTIGGSLEHTFIACPMTGKGIKNVFHYSHKYSTYLRPFRNTAIPRSPPNPLNRFSSFSNSQEKKWKLEHWTLKILNNSFRKGQSKENGVGSILFTYFAMSCMLLCHIQVTLHYKTTPISNRWIHETTNVLEKQK